MISLNLDSSCVLSIDGTPSGKSVQFTIASELQAEYNKFEAYFVLDSKTSKHLVLALTSNVSQQIDVEALGSQFTKNVKVFVYCEDDTLSDNDGFENRSSNSISLDFSDKTLSDYGITDAYTKGEVDTKIPTKVSDLQNDTGFITQNDISGKADSSDVYSKSQTYSKEEINSMIGDVEEQLASI